MVPPPAGAGIGDWPDSHMRTFPKSEQCFIPRAEEYRRRRDRYGGAPLGLVSRAGMQRLLYVASYLLLAAAETSVMRQPCLPAGNCAK
jgi:hypothetical protein